MSEVNSWSRVQILSISVVIVGFIACSTFPIIFGTQRSVVTDKVASTEVTGLGICHNESSEELVRLQLLVEQSNARIKYLTEMASALQSAMDAYEPPKCTMPDDIDVGLKQLFGEQALLNRTMVKLREQFQIAAIASNVTLMELHNNASAKYELLHNNVVSLTSEISNVTAIVEAYKSDAQLLETVHNVSSGVLNEVKQLDERIAALNHLPEAIAALTATASNLTCPEPIIPIVLAPIIVNQTAPTVEKAPTAPAKPLAAKNVTRTPPQECVNMTSAQSIVKQLVTAETLHLVQNLTDQLTASTEGAAAALRSAVSDIASNAVEEFLHESSRLHDFDAHHSAMVEKLVRATASETSSRAKKSNTDSDDVLLQRRREASKNGSVGGIPELDFALLSAGSRVLHDRTSKTYFPEGWRLDQQVGGALSWAGLPQAVVKGAKDAVAAVSSGQQVYEALNLHKSVGRPEDALIADTRPGACWPMQGGSGNLTILLTGSVVIESVSIDHAASSRYVSFFFLLSGYFMSSYC